LTNVVVESILENVDFALNITFKLGNSTIDLVLSLIFSAGQLRFNASLAFLSNFVDDPLSDGDRVDVQGLSVSLVVIRVKLNALS